MTEAEWLACEAPEPMLEFLRTRVVRTKKGRRKLRLLACGGCRHAYHLLSDTDSRAILDIVERFADDEATKRELIRANSTARKANRGANAACAPRFAKEPRHVTHPALYATYAVIETSATSDIYQAVFIAMGLLGQAAHESINATEGAVITEYFSQQVEARAAMLLLLSGIVRDIFGNPLRPAVIESTWLTSSVTSLAHAIYDERAFEHMPILADALEDAGCTDATILEHCRSGGEHVRGCWVVDLLLGRE